MRNCAQELLTLDRQKPGHGYHRRIALRRESIEVSPRQFFHVGKWVMPAGMLAATAGVLLMRLVGAL